METKIEVLVKDVFGKERIYPANKIASQFCDLLGRKCFTRAELAQIQAMGYEVKQVHPMLLLKGGKRV